LLKAWKNQKTLLFLCAPDKKASGGDGESPPLIRRSPSVSSNIRDRNWSGSVLSEPDDLFLNLRNLSNQVFKFLVVLNPPDDFWLHPSGNIEWDGLTTFFPGDIEDRMFGSSLMADAILFATESGGWDQGAFNPGDKGMDFLERLEAFGFQRLF
jgi:hypothetical protein